MHPSRMIALLPLYLKSKDAPQIISEGCGGVVAGAPMPLSVWARLMFGRLAGSDMLLVKGLQRAKNKACPTAPSRKSIGPVSLVGHRKGS